MYPSRYKIFHETFRLAVPYKIEDVGLTRHLKLSPLLERYFKFVGEIFSFQNILFLHLQKNQTIYVQVHRVWFLLIFIVVYSIDI